MPVCQIIKLLRSPKDENRRYIEFSYVKDFMEKYEIALQAAEKEINKLNALIIIYEVDKKTNDVSIESVKVALIVIKNLKKEIETLNKRIKELEK